MPSEVHEVVVAVGLAVVALVWFAFMIVACIVLFRASFGEPRRRLPRDADKRAGRRRARRYSSRARREESLGRRRQVHAP
jgi:hypothetical protein